MNLPFLNICVVAMTSRIVVLQYMQYKDGSWLEVLSSTFSDILVLQILYCLDLEHTWDQNFFTWLLFGKLRKSLSLHWLLAPFATLVEMSWILFHLKVRLSRLVKVLRAFNFSFLEPFLLDFTWLQKFYFWVLTLHCYPVYNYYTWNIISKLVHYFPWMSLDSQRANYSYPLLWLDV